MVPPAIAVSGTRHPYELHISENWNPFDKMGPGFNKMFQTSALNFLIDLHFLWAGEVVVTCVSGEQEQYLLYPKSWFLGREKWTSALTPRPSLFLSRTVSSTPTFLLTFMIPCYIRLNFAISGIMCLIFFLQIINSRIWTSGCRVQRFTVPSHMGIA